MSRRVNTTSAPRALTLQSDRVGCFCGTAELGEGLDRVVSASLVTDPAVRLREAHVTIPGPCLCGQSSSVVEVKAWPHPQPWSPGINPAVHIRLLCRAPQVADQ